MRTPPGRPPFGCPRFRSDAPPAFVPNDAGYTVTVTHLTNPAITASAQLFAAICDLPTFPLPPELPTLAADGVG
jgi:hypothetical protein